MKTVVCTKAGNLLEPDEARRGVVEVLNWPEQPLGDEEVRIKVAYCAISSADPRLVDGLFGWEPPFGVGHEMSGVVVELGCKANKKGLKIGDRVGGCFMRFCGSCYFCNNGQQQFCTFGEEGSNPCMAETVVWHESMVFKLPQETSLAAGCLLGPVSAAVRIADKSELKVGQRVCVSGGGAVGQLCLQILKLHGATSLTLIEPKEYRRNLGLKSGAGYVINPNAQNIYEMAMKITDEHGFDVVIDVSGSPKAIPPLFDIANRGARLVLGAQYPLDYHYPLNLYECCYYKELNITGIYLAPYTFPRAASLLPSLMLDEFTKVIYPIDDVKEAFDAHMSGKYHKVLIRCNDDLE